MSGSPESFDEVCDGLWVALSARGVPPGSPQELHVSWRCPTVAAAEALEAALPAAGGTVGVAQPNAEAGGRGFGVAATVSVLADRGQLIDVLTQMAHLGAAHGGTVCAVGIVAPD